ncbi:MAG: hypothetical protein O3A95_09655 [Planctomycetota bacterium]|nr:hypothetical protein [Planctomycetota bacterium]MDA1114546.1 hypothetical protein [Planctomycetota bacterium]
MNRTLLTLTGLLLAAPLAAQQPSANEMKASELLQLSAQKAMAGYEDEATKLAAMAMELLAKDTSTFKDEVRFVLEEYDNVPIGQAGLLECPHEHEIIEFIGSEDIEMEDVRGPFGDSAHNGSWMTDGDVHQNVPMPNGDLHQQLREIQHELESLRHELRALRSDMNGGRRGTRFQMRMAPGQVQRLDLHQLEGMPHNLKLHEMHDMQGHKKDMELHGMFMGEGEDFDFEFDLPKGAEIHEEVVVFINGEKFTGDAAREKLKVLNLNMKGEAEGKVRMRMGGKRGAFPTPPMPPEPQQQNRWRSQEHGHDHEEL